jgi:hypothetical protein
MCVASPEIDCKVLEHVAPIYFAIFVLATQFVLLNVVVAVLMKHLEDAKEDGSNSGSRDSIMSLHRGSKDQEGAIVSLKVPPPETFRKVSFDEDSGNKQGQTTVEISGTQNGGRYVLPLVAVNGEDLNSDSEYSITSPLPKAMAIERQKPVLSQSTPILRPVLRTRNRSSSAAPRIVKDMSSSSSLARFSPILGRLSKPRPRYDDSDELVSHAHVVPPLELSAMINQASENDISPDSDNPMSPRAPIYKMSEDSDLNDSVLDGDMYDSSPPRPSRHSLKSTTSGSSSSSYDDDRNPPTQQVIPRQRYTQRAPSSTPEGEKLASKGEALRRRPFTGDKKGKRNKKQSYV